MAQQPTGLLGRNKVAVTNAQTGNQPPPAPAAQPYVAGSLNGGPYQGGLQSQFNYGAHTAPGTYGGGDGSMPGLENYLISTNPGYLDMDGMQDRRAYTHSRDSGDSDVAGAADAAWELAHPSSGTNGAEQQALLNLYQGRIGTKNSLAEQIAGNQGQENSQEDLLRSTADKTLSQGLKNTRQNYNSRGLLYSGLRQGGENQVKNNTAATLAAGLSESKRGSANSLATAKNAYAAVDLANAQESLNLAHEAFDTASANNIARMQAFQQLGSGVGQAAGTIAGPKGVINNYYGTAEPNMIDSNLTGNSSRTA